MDKKETSMKPRCELTSNLKTYRENSEACQDTAAKIVEQLKPVIEMRHKIGKAMTATDEGKTLSVLTKELSDTAMPILDAYAREEENCKKTDNAQSCIYAEQFRSFIKFFGPIIPIMEGVKYNPTSIEMAHLKNGYIVVPLEPKKSGVEVFLDTGAGGTVLSLEFANTHKDSVSVLSRNAEYGQNTPVVAFRDMKFDLGGITFEPTSGMVSSIGDFFEGSDKGRKLIAILGADLLFPRSWEVDHDRSIFVLEQDVEKELSKDNRWDQVSLFPSSYGVTFHTGIDVFINGRSFRLELDTGANTTGLIEQCPLPDMGGSKGTFTVTLEGLHEEKELKNTRVKLGDYGSSADITITPKNAVNAGIAQKMGFCGFLGTDVLSNYDYMYDPQTLSLYIKPRDKKEIPRFRRTGFVPKRTKQENEPAVFTVVEIIPETPAEKAGLKPGDIIMDIDSMNSNSISMMELLDMSYSSKPEIPITIVRNGETKRLILQFKK